MKQFKDIYLIEDHHQALDIWRMKKFKNLPLVHLDAHIDFNFYPANPIRQAIKEAKTFSDLKKRLEAALLYKRYKDDFEKQLNLGNYIYPAMRDRIIKDFYWIIPADKKDHLESYKGAVQILQGLKTKDPYRSKSLNELFKNNIKINDIFSLKAINRRVLLDIDVDFAFFASTRNTTLTRNIGRRRPWISPIQIVRMIKKRIPKAACITIAYSVNGGFTPIEYKFVGDEIYLRFSNLVDEQLEEVFSLRNKGIANAAQGKPRLSIAALESAVRKLKRHTKFIPEFKARFFAHLYFWLFKINWQLKQKEKAKGYYQAALKADPSYRVKDNNLGPLYWQKGDIYSAQKEVEKILFCDPKDPFALCGLGQVFTRRRQYKLALKCYRKALLLNPMEKQAFLGKAVCLLKLHRLVEAEKILSFLKEKEPLDISRALLEAHLYKKASDLKKALLSYKEALLLGGLGVEHYREIFRILQIEKDKDLSMFFKRKYALFKKDFYKSQNRRETVDKP